jgi:hypothetical protein
MSNIEIGREANKKTPTQLNTQPISSNLLVSGLFIIYSLLKVAYGCRTGIAFFEKQHKPRILDQESKPWCCSFLREQWLGIIRLGVRSVENLSPDPSGVSIMYSNQENGNPTEIQDSEIQNSHLSSNSYKHSRVLPTLLAS